jgi:hypothetical protein
MKAEYEPIALQDIYPGADGKSILDKDKVLLLYAKTHKIAADYPDHPIDFQFFDDTATMMINFDTSGGIPAAARTNPAFLPNNTTVHFINYTPIERNRDKAAIFKECENGRFIGHGVIDSHYADTVNLMMANAPDARDDKYDVRSVNVGKRHLSPSMVQKCIDASALSNLLKPDNLLQFKTIIADLLIGLIKTSATKETLGDMPRYRSLLILAGILGSQSNNEVKAQDIRSLCLSDHEVLACCAELIEQYKEIIARTTSAGSGSAAMVFADSSKTYCPEIDLVIDVIKTLVPYIEANLSEVGLFGGANILLNGHSYKVPDGVKKLYDYALSENSPEQKIANIRKLITEKLGSSKPGRSPRTTSLYEALNRRMNPAPAKDLSLTASKA